MIIETHLDFKKYLELCFTLTYRKPIVIIVTLVGICNIFWFFFPLESMTQPFVNIVGGIFLIAITPITVYIHASKFFNSNQRVKEKIVYKFSDGKIKSIAESSVIEFDYKNIYKTQELRNWFLIYHDIRSVNAIPKKQLDKSQVLELKDILFKINKS
jgi:hypothetical protein